MVSAALADCGLSCINYLIWKGKDEVARISVKKFDLTTVERDILFSTNKYQLEQVELVFIKLYRKNEYFSNCGNVVWKIKCFPKKINHQGDTFAEEIICFKQEFSQYVFFISKFLPIEWNNKLAFHPTFLFVSFFFFFFWEQNN